MPGYLIAILLNLISNLLSWLIVFTALFLFYVLHLVRRRRNLLNFLGIYPQNLQIRVYFSSFLLNPGTVDDLEKKKTLWGGLAISAGEFQIIPDIDKWLSILARRSNFFEYLFDYLSPKKLRTPYVQIEYLPSPHMNEDLKLNNCTLILIGGPLHNLGTKLYYDQNLVFMRSSDWRIAVEVIKGKQAGRILGPNLSPNDLSQGDFKHPGIDMAILERQYDKERNSTIFLASGTGTNGTMAAICYLISHWKELNKRHKNTPFSICLECPRKALEPGSHWAADIADPSCYQNSTVHLELP
jgi:hypothetical protein